MLLGNALWQRAVQCQVGELVTFVTRIKNQIGTVGQIMIDRDVFSVGRIERIKSRAELRRYLNLGLVETLQRGEVISGCFVDATRQETQFVIDDHQIALQANAAVDFF